MKESDLYEPVKRLLESQGYEVKGEVHSCDVVAVRGQEAPVVVELKLSLNLEVLLQAVDRLALTSKVYVGVPERCRVVHRRRKPLLKLLRRLGLGLLLVDDSQVEILLDPGDYRPRKSKFRLERLLGEFERRVGDPDPGGSDNSRKRMTAYRQQALSLASYLKNAGPTKASLLAKELQQPKARDILYRNVYGWFERVATGVYQLSPRGERELPSWNWPPNENNL